MKAFLKTTFALITIAFVTACGDRTQETKKVDDHGHALSHEPPPIAQKPVLKDDKLNAVYQHYIHLTNALINEDEGEAKMAANAIGAGAKLIEGGGAVESASARILNASGIEEQRKVYSELSNSIIALAKQSGMASGELYIDYCPMAMNDKGGYWLSSIKPIRNPYFGDKMMSCGEVKDTIKAGS